MRPVLSIVIPCLNEKETVAAVIRDAQIHALRYFPGKHEIIVADNDSSDGTLEILKKVRWKNIVHVPVRGYGAALHWGILKAAGKYVLYADADGSYPFSNLRRFQTVLSSDPDLVLGSRLRGHIAPGAMPWLHRYLGTPMLTWLIRLIYRLPTTDCNSGMRLVKKSFYRSLNMRNSGMEWASELLLKTAVKKGRYGEVPIRFLKDKRSGRPHLSTWADGWRHLKTIILLKPSSLYVLLIVLPLAARVLLPVSFAASFLLLLLTLVLILSLLTFDLLKAVIEGRPTRVSIWLNRFTLVPLTGAATLAIAVFIWLVPDSRLGTKLFLVSVIGVVLMWILLVETIKTHLLNRLPDKI